MRLAWFSVVVLALGCGGEKRAEVPPPAAFSDATVDVGNKKDSAPPPVDSSTDVLLADASDVLVGDGPDGDAPSDCVIDKTCVGAPMPTWKLEDFQPKSTGFKKTYGLEAFKGKVTVVALLSGW